MAEYTLLAKDIVEDPLIPDYQKQTSKWYLEGLLQNASYFNGVAWYANRNFYLKDGVDFGSRTGELQQAIQLIALGNSTVDRANENVRQDQKDIEQDIARADLQAQLNAVNKRLSEQVVDLGDAVTDASQGATQGSILGSLGLGAGLSSLVILGIIGAVLIKKI